MSSVVGSRRCVSARLPSPLAMAVLLLPTAPTAVLLLARSGGRVAGAILGHCNSAGALRSGGVVLAIGRPGEASVTERLRRVALAPDRDCGAAFTERLRRARPRPPSRCFLAPWRWRPTPCHSPGRWPFPRCTRTSPLVAIGDIGSAFNLRRGIPHPCALHRDKSTSRHTRGPRVRPWLYIHAGRPRVD